MKYWTELNNLEDAIFQIKKLNSQLSVMMDSELIRSNDERIPEEYKDFLYDFSDRFENAMAELNAGFQHVWDVVRDDSFDKAIEESEDEIVAKERWSKIVRSMMPKESAYPSPNEWGIELQENGDFNVTTDNTMASQPNQNDTLVIQEVAGNLTATYRPDTQEDLFDEQWEEAYKKQSDR